MGRMAPLPQDEEESPTSTAHFPFGLSHDPYDTFVKQQLMLLEDELRSLGVEDSLVQEPLGTGHPCAYFSIRPSAGEFDLLSFEEQLRALEAGLNGHDLRKLRMLETLSEHAYRMVRMHQLSITNAVGYLSFFRMVQHECREMKCQ
eukprot:s3801_g4.t4